MEKIQLLLILLFSVGLRIAAAFLLGDQVVNLPGTADQVSYHNLALRVLDGHGFSFEKTWWPLTAAGAPTAHWSYLYTLYLTGVYAVFGPHPLVARFIQAIIFGILQPYLTYRLAIQIVQPHALAGQAKQPEAAGRVAGRGSAQGRWGDLPITNRRVPLIAAGIAAVYPYFVYYAATLMTEPFFIIAVLASITLAISISSRKSERVNYPLATLLGLTLTAAVLLRQLFLLFLPIIFLWLLVSAGKTRAWSYSIPTIAISVVILILSILPITIYNYSRFNQFVLLNTNAGFAFFWANHPIYDTEFIPASEMDSIYQTLIPQELRRLNEASLDKELLKLGIQYVVNNPERYLRLSLSRIPLYFKFWPDPDSRFISNIARVTSFGFFLPFMLYGLLLPLFNSVRSVKQSFRIRPSSAIVLLYLFITIYTLIHILSWVQVRYRLPVDAVLIPFAALAVTDFLRFVERGFHLIGARRTIYN